jgi:hypothetical protein
MGYFPILSLRQHPHLDTDIDGSQRIGTLAYLLRLMGRDVTCLTGRNPEDVGRQTSWQPGQPATVNRTPDESPNEPRSPSGKGLNDPILFARE